MRQGNQRPHVYLGDMIWPRSRRTTSRSWLAAPAARAVEAVAAGEAALREGGAAAVGAVAGPPQMLPLRRPKRKKMAQKQRRPCVAEAADEVGPGAGSHPFSQHSARCQASCRAAPSPR